MGLSQSQDCLYVYFDSGGNSIGPLETDRKTRLPETCYIDNLYVTSFLTGIMTRPTCDTP